MDSHQPFHATREGGEQAPVFGQAPALGGRVGGVSELQITHTLHRQPSGNSCKNG